VPSLSCQGQRTTDHVDGWLGQTCLKDEIAVVGIVIQWSSLVVQGMFRTRFRIHLIDLFKWKSGDTEGMGDISGFSSLFKSESQNIVVVFPVDGGFRPAIFSVFYRPGVRLERLGRETNPSEVR
jgi:hypothetical protein